MAREGLTPKQAAFVREYLIDGNATQAAIRAGYSEKTARFIAAENLTKPLVSAAIKAQQSKLNERTEVAAAVILAEIDNEATIDIGDLYDDAGNLLPIKQMPAAVRRCIQSMKVKRYTEGKGDAAEAVEILEVKLVDRLGAQRLALQRRGLLTDKIEHSGGLMVTKAAKDMTDDELASIAALASEPTRSGS